MKVLQSLVDKRIAEIDTAVAALDKDSFQESSHQLGRLMALRPQNRFPWIELERKDLRMDLNGLDLPDTFGARSLDDENKTLAREPLWDFLKIEMFRATVAAQTFAENVEQPFVPERTVTRIKTSFSENYLHENFSFPFSLAAIVNLAMARELFDYSQDAVGPKEQLLAQCIDLASPGLLITKSLRAIALETLRTCQTGTLKQALATFDSEAIRTTLDKWAQLGRRFCNSEDCREDFSRTLHSNYNYYPPEADSSSFTEREIYASDFLRYEYSSPSAKQAFGARAWKKAAKLYLERAELLEEFLVGKDKSDLSDVIAELRHNAAMALWNDNQVERAISSLNDILEIYPDYVAGDPIAKVVADYRADAELKTEYVMLKDYRRILDQAFAAPPDDFAGRADKYEEAAEEYERVTGKKDTLNLLRAARNYEQVNTQKATATYQLACTSSRSELSEKDTDSIDRDCTLWPLRRDSRRLRDEANKAFDKNNWTTAIARYLDAETSELKRQEKRLEYGLSVVEGLPAECAFNASMALKNDSLYGEARTILRRIQRQYPNYNTAVVRRHLSDIAEACPNPYLRCSY